ncbi:MAG: SDR family oxidoreductase [Armatimonadetes bacterium]|nr:SDR family oxidoreductase [Armatimonadota bacterium]
MSLRGKVLVVTGASSGIGRAAALAWGQERATVILVARRREVLREVANTIVSAGGEAHPLCADVSFEPDVDRVRAFLDEVAGRVDLLFNCAGTGHPRWPLHELPVDEFDRVMAVNLRGAYLMTRALVPLLAARRGSHVVNVTSAQKSAPLHGAYSVSKSALDALTRVMAQELAPLGIRVNTFNPGSVRTDLAPEAPESVDTVISRLLELAREGEDGPTGQEIHG